MNKSLKARVLIQFKSIIYVFFILFVLDYLFVMIELGVLLLVYSISQYYMPWFYSSVIPEESMHANYIIVGLTILLQ